MLLPDKHITLAESLLGLGSFILAAIDRPRSVDEIYNRVVEANETKELPAFHNFESVVLAILFLYTVGAVDMTPSGRIRRCAS